MFNTDVQATWDIVFLRNDLRKCVNKKHPEQVKTDLTNLKVFSTFCRLDCTYSKSFQPSEELEKITAPASLHVTFIDSTQRLTRSSAVFFGYLPNIINDCYCRRSSYSPNKASPSSHLTSHIYSGHLAATEHSGASRSSTPFVVGARFLSELQRGSRFRVPSRVNNIAYTSTQFYYTVPLYHNKYNIARSPSAETTSPDQSSQIILLLMCTCTFMLVQIRFKIY